MISKLHYVVYSKLYITKDVGMLERVQSNLKESHMVAMKIMFIYLKINIDYGLRYYPKGDSL